jgi:acyl-CoA thioesterase I
MTPMMKRLLCLLLVAMGVVEAPAAAETNAIKTVLVLGDSLAAGYGVDPEESFPAVLQSKVREAGLPFTVVNGGVSGDTTAGGRRRIDWLLRRPVDVLLLELGGNDGLRGIPPESTRTNLQAIIDKTLAKNPHAKLVVAGMQMPSNMGREFNEHYARIFREVAEKNGAALIPFLLEGVGGDPKLNQPDMIHPTSKGHAIVAETCWKVLKPVLEAIPAAASGVSSGPQKDKASVWVRRPSVQ